MSDFLVLKKDGNLVQVMPAESSYDSALTQLQTGQIDTIQRCSKESLAEAISIIEPTALIKEKINKFAKYVETMSRDLMKELPAEKDLASLKDAVLDIGQKTYKEIKEVLKTKSEEK